MNSFLFHLKQLLKHKIRKGSKTNGSTIPVRHYIHIIFYKRSLKQ